ncbi:hypothetical protein OAM69_05720 [bacterium]|nr:hypothetical protein [bacterium]
MLGLAWIAAYNLLESYKARFRPNPNGEGYLFSDSDYGEGVPCSVEQYHQLLNEFSRHVTRSLRLMWLWAITLFVLTIAGAVLVFSVRGHLMDILSEAIDGRYANLFAIGWMCLLMAPLLISFIKGHKLYRKPALELSVAGSLYQGGGVERKRASADITDRRIKGMSRSMLLIWFFLSVVSTIIVAMENNFPASIELWMLFPPLSTLASIYLMWRKRKVEQRETRTLAAQDDAANS